MYRLEAGGHTCKSCMTCTSSSVLLAPATMLGFCGRNMRLPMVLQQQLRAARRAQRPAGAVAEVAVGVAHMAALADLL
jgi:hypothetical protein